MRQLPRRCASRVAHRKPEDVQWRHRYIAGGNRETSSVTRRRTVKHLYWRNQHRGGKVGRLWEDARCCRVYKRTIKDARRRFKHQVKRLKPRVRLPIEPTLAEEEDLRLPDEWIDRFVMGLEDLMPYSQNNNAKDDSINTICTVCLCKQKSIADVMLWIQDSYVIIIYLLIISIKFQ